MAWWTSLEDNVNHPRLTAEQTARVVSGREPVAQAIARNLIADVGRLRRPVFLAVDGYKGARFADFLSALERALAPAGVKLDVVEALDLFRSEAEVERLIAPSVSNDPSFGRVIEGDLEQLMSPERVAAFADTLDVMHDDVSRKAVVVASGIGAAIPALRPHYDRVAYLDLPRHELIKRSEAGRVSGVGRRDRQPVHWKRAYYVEYPLLNGHKKRVLSDPDWFVDDTDAESPTLVPSDVYRAMMAGLAASPVTFKVFYMPGTFGGTEFASLFKVPGLSNTSWDYEVSVGDNHMLVDAGDGRILEIPIHNLLFAEPLAFLGEFAAREYPDHFPLAVYMQDGYFEPGDQADFKRTHMPHHLHPDSAYARENFNEPLGRYETYYIVRADEGACTMHGFRDDADLDEYVREVVHSSETGREFDWRKYVYEHQSRSGELHQLPPGTVHGTGGRQMIMEIDTNPSRESTEYSFYLYDYCRPNYNYETHDMTGNPARLHLKHGLAVMRRNRKQDFMRRYARPEPEVLRQGDGWREVSFPMYFNMPYQVNRLEFTGEVRDDTAGLFHMLALTKGASARVYQVSDPSNGFEMAFCDNVVLPASFGPYAIENTGGGGCEVVKTFLRTEPHPDFERLQSDLEW